MKKANRLKDLFAHGNAPMVAEQNSRGNGHGSVELGTILVPVDFSALSLHALDFAIGLAGRLNAAVILTHVLNPLHTPGKLDAARLRPLRAEAIRQARENLAAVARRKLPRGSRQRVITGIAHRAIVDFAKKLHADLIVMGSKGNSGIKRLLVGSVAENVVRQAPCPVLIVRKVGACP